MSSENKKSNKNDSGSNGSPQRFQPKVLLVYLVIVAAILTIWFANPGARSNVKQLTISELVEAVKNGQIAEDDGVMEVVNFLREESSRAILQPKTVDGV